MWDLMALPSHRDLPREFKEGDRVLVDAGYDGITSPLDIPMGSRKPKEGDRIIVDVGSMA
jgi:hypothetical protein